MQDINNFLWGFMALIKSLYLGRYSDSIHLNNSDSNKITILLGVNGTSKSRMLRALLDGAVSTISNEPKLICSYSDLDLSRACYSEYYENPKKIIAISSVPTDRFPTKSRFSNSRTKNTIHDINEYEYIGPKHNSNIVSRMQSLEALITLSLSNKKLNESQKSFIKKLSNKTDVPYNFDVKVLSVELMNAIIIPSFKNQRNERRVNEILESSDFQDKIADRSWFNTSQYILKDILDHRSELSFSLTNEINIEDEYKSVLLDHLKMKSIKLSSRFSGSHSKGNGDSPVQGIDHFSSGQWGLFSSLSALSLSVVENSLILIDEPESTLHPSWQRSYIDDLLQAISHVKGCHIFIATHSPLLVNSLPEKRGEIILLKRKNGEIVAEKFDNPPHGWDANDTLESFFDLDSTRPISVVNIVEEALRLIAGGFTNNKEKLLEIIPNLNALMENLPDEDDLKSIISSLVKAVNKGVKK